MIPMATCDSLGSRRERLLPGRHGPGMDPVCRSGAVKAPYRTGIAFEMSELERKVPPIGGR
jgi:hypothetical protein